MADETLADVLDWTTYEVVAGLAATHVPVHIGTAGDSGPVGVLTASVHGDEGPWSTIAINRMLSRVRASELTGTLRVVPVANPLATEADARQAELDPLDLNNSFGGDATGTHTQRLARLLADKALDGSDVVLDVHGGGSWNVNCFTYRFPGSHELASWMRTPLICDGPDRPASLTGYARAQGATAVWIEMGGRGEWEDERIEAVATGLRHALGRAGVLTPVDAAGPDPMVATGMTAFAVSVPGILSARHPGARAGHRGRGRHADRRAPGSRVEPGDPAVRGPVRAQLPGVAEADHRPDRGARQGGGGCRRCDRGHPWLTGRPGRSAAALSGSPWMTPWSS